MRSRDLDNWEMVCDLFDYRHAIPKKTDFNMWILSLKEMILFIFAVLQLTILIVIMILITAHFIE